MSCLLTILIVVTLLIDFTSSLYKSILLNTTNVGGISPGIRVSRIPQNVNISNQYWRIDPKTQNGYDLLLWMNHKWGFNNLSISTISLTLNGYTPKITEIDGEFLMVFGVSDHEYFSVVIRLDTQRNSWKSYPIGDGSSSYALTQNIFFDVISNNGETRWNRVSNNDKWFNIHPLYKEKLIWPFTIQLINNPINNTLIYKCILNNQTILTLLYNNSFTTNTGLEIYILNDDENNKPFDIYSINVEYNSNISINDSYIDDDDIATTDFFPSWFDLSESTMIIQSYLSSTNIISPKDDDDDDNNNTTLTIIIVLACIIGCLLILITLFCIYRKRNKKMSNTNKVVDINKGEYHTPEIDVIDVEDVLDASRRESLNYSQNKQNTMKNQTKKKPKPPPLPKRKIKNGGLIQVKSQDDDDDTDDAYDCYGNQSTVTQNDENQRLTTDGA